ncbi:stealth family protein [Kluyvera genomosp. 1]|uniref:stealth family protein n=1 Tax=Kluyvera genomosp. 1 TaxID=2774053 RepID=UPI00068FC764|nr:stealth family protein [Kluyvera genomosp. 1]
MKKLFKLVRTPGLFFRDYLMKRHPIIRNEIRCPLHEERVLIDHDIVIESKLSTNFPVDVVYTWVDNNDIKWLEKINNYNVKNKERLGRYSTDKARFDNHNEIFYSIKSVLINMPWVRNIFIVTDNQIPDVLYLSSKIKVVDHHDIIDEAFLPTFNSHVIEAHLHKIEGLSENFIYFNDDVFAARPLTASHFFKSNGIASLFISSKDLDVLKQRGVDTPTLSASISSRVLLNADYDVPIGGSLVHTYIPLKKSMFTLAWDIYAKEILGFLSNRFRTNYDLNLATYLVPWLAYLEGQAVLARDICYYFNIRSNSAIDSYRALINALHNGCQPHSFCANDFHTEKEAIDNYQILLITTLESYFKADNSYTTNGICNK